MTSMRRPLAFAPTWWADARRAEPGPRVQAPVGADGPRDVIGPPGVDGGRAVRLADNGHDGAARPVRREGAVWPSGAGDCDAEIIGASWRDPRQFGALFDRHYSSIYRYVARRAGHDVAEDVAAETFTVAFAQRATYDAAFPDALPWLFGIAHNLLRTHQRAERRLLAAYTRRGADPAVDAAAAEAFGRADLRLDAAAAAPAIAAALDAMAPGDRDVLLLIAWTDLSYTDVARALGLPVGTVRSRLHRARAQLKPRLAAVRPGHTEDTSERATRAGEGPEGRP